MDEKIKDPPVPITLDKEKIKTCAVWTRKFLNRTNVTADEVNALNLEGLVEINFPHDMSAKDVVEEMRRINPNWYVKIHFTWGMWMRNQLRLNGFNEIFFNVDNLDDYYVELINAALDLKEETNVEKSIGN